MYIITLLIVNFFLSLMKIYEKTYKIYFKGDRVRSKETHL